MSFKPWDYFNDLTNNKKELIRNSDNPELTEKYYEPWILNKALSYFQLRTWE